MAVVTQPESRASGLAPPVANGGAAPWPHVAVLFAMTAIYVASYAFSLGIPDSTRDVYTAYQIRVGRSFPLEGPVLGEAIHGGPAWFYLLAVPLFVYKSWLAVSVFAGAVAGLKFALAYVCGSRMVDRRFGLVWASVLALPGWTTIQQIAFTNVNAVETCVLAALYFAIRVWENPSLPWVFALGMACGLAFHAHPTTVPVIPLSLAAALLSVSRHHRATVIAVFSIACLAPFVPYFVSQMLHGFPDFRSGVGYVATSVELRQAANVVGIVRSILLDGPLLIARDVVGVPEPRLRYAQAGLIVFMTAALIGAIASARAPGHSRILWLTGGTAVVFAVVIACLRATTPAYFTYALIPSVAALVALGVRSFTQNRLGSTILYGFVTIVIALQALVELRIAAETDQGVGIVPAVDNVSTGALSEPSTNVWFPSLAHDASGTFLCRHGDRVVVHGSLAFLVDANVGVDTLLRCGRIPEVQLSGTADADREHWVGMPRAFWTQVALTPRCWIGPLGLSTAMSVGSPSNSVARVSGETFRPRPFSQEPSIERDLGFETHGEQALVLTNVTPWYMPWQVLSVKVDGREIAPLAITVASRLYVAPAVAAAASNRWDVRFTAPDTDKIDVVAIGPSAGATGAVPSCTDP